MSVANKDEALRCLDKARAFWNEGNIARAKHFADKAQTLYTCPEIDAFKRDLQRSGNGPSTASPKPTPSSQHSGGGASGSAAGTSRNGNAATPAQQEMIARIRRSKGEYYKVLGVDRSADEDEIKKSYRKLALKLHPDKCQAPGAEEAFKEVSKAFSCLTDQDKRAFYDRTGHEDMASAAAARAGAGHGPQFRADHIDPQDLFNMMFGGGMNGAFGMGPMHFGGFQQHPGFRQQRRQAQQQANPMAGPSGTPGLSTFIQSLQANPMRMIFFVAMVLQTFAALGPLIFSVLGWFFWAVLLGAPLWLVSREIVEFERRQVYAPLREIPVVRNTVQGMHGYASAYLRFCQPAVSFADSVRLMIAELGRTLA